MSRHLTKVSTKKNFKAKKKQNLFYLLSGSPVLVLMLGLTS